MHATRSHEITDDLLDTVAEEIAAATRAGIPSRDLDMYVKDRLRQRCGGAMQYVRKRNHSERDAEICRAFNGRNANELATEHQITPRRVRQIAARGAACPETIL
jgi:Mor family transcriptional regulator